MVYTVAPAAASPAARSATISACGPPGGSVAPSPTTTPSRTITAPTHGLGAVRRRARAARATARAISSSSRSLDTVTTFPRSAGFYRLVWMALCVFGLVLVIDVATGWGGWSLWVGAIMGILIALRFLSVFVFDSLLGREAERRMIEAELRKRESRGH